MTGQKASRTARAAVGASDLYRDYGDWKGWEQTFVCDEARADYYRGELAGIPLQGRRVLEIGFGDGAFLAWAEAQGAVIAGSEVNPTSIAAAKVRGVTLLPADFGARMRGGRFDLVVAFDVFEHLDLSAISDRLKVIEALLEPGGRLLLRYPNVQSPFGLSAQFGDATHLTGLSGAKIDQLCAATVLRTERYAAAYRPLGRGVLRPLLRRAKHGLRDGLGRAMNALYGLDLIWDPVVVQVLRKP